MNKKRKMYIDVDGVLVVWNPAKSCIELSRGYGELMRFCLIHDIQPYWLTMWSDSPEHLEGLSRLLWPDICPTMAQPRILKVGSSNKADCIDYNSDFVWIEDGLGDHDIDILKSHNAFDRFFYTNGQNPDCLLEFMTFTQNRLDLPDITDWESGWHPDITLPEEYR